MTFDIIIMLRNALPLTVFLGRYYREFIRTVKVWGQSYQKTFVPKSEKVFFQSLSQTYVGRYYWEFIITIKVCGQSYQKPLAPNSEKFFVPISLTNIYKYMNKSVIEINKQKQFNKQINKQKNTYNLAMWGSQWCFTV